MILREMIEFVKQHHPGMGEKEIIILLNEAMDDFSADTRIIEGYVDFDTTIDQRYYDISDDVLEIKEVLYDAGSTVTATMSGTDSTGDAGSPYSFTLNPGHGLLAKDAGTTVILSGFTELADLNGITTQLKTVSTNVITLEGIISNGTQETSPGATFTFTGIGTSGGKRIPRLIGLPDERDLG